jgi:hypothetical protein
MRHLISYGLEYKNGLTVPSRKTAISSKFILYLIKKNSVSDLYQIGLSMDTRSLEGQNLNLEELK